jgi:hypothetical protein
MESAASVFRIAKKSEPLCVIGAWCNKTGRLKEHIDDFGKAVGDICGVAVPLLLKPKTITQPTILVGLINKATLARRILNEDQILKTGAGSALVKASEASRSMLFPEDLGDQGYIVHPTTRNSHPVLILVANTNQGIYYGLLALQDRIHKRKGVFCIADIGSRLLPVLNKPLFKSRSMASFISGPCFIKPGQCEREFGGDHRAFIDWMASHRINHLLDWSFTPDAGVGFESKRFPELVNRLHPNVKNEYMADMLAYARKRYIDTWLFFKLPFRDYARDKSNADSQPVYVTRNTSGGDAGIMPHVETPCFDVDRFEGKTIRFVCMSDKRTKRFWKEYIEELLLRYKDIGGVGCEVGEHLTPYCQCPSCKGRTLELGQEFFRIMAKTARKINPAMKLWFYQAKGATRMMQDRSEFPDAVQIDWGNRTEPWEMGRSVPRGDWYLYHTGSESSAEPGIRKACSILSRHRVDGIQIRATSFKEWDHKYHAFNTFTWNPDLSLADFAHLQTIREQRKANPSDAKLYRTWMEYVEANNTLNYSDLVIRKTPSPWLEHEDTQAKCDEWRADLDQQLSAIKRPSKRVAFIRDALLEMECRLEEFASDFSIITNGMEISKPWPGIIVLSPGGYVQTDLNLRPTSYRIRLAMKNFGSDECVLRALINGKVVGEYTLAPSDAAKDSVNGWSGSALSYTVTLPGTQTFRVELVSGEAGAFHKIRAEAE